MAICTVRRGIECAYLYLHVIIVIMYHGVWTLVRFWGDLVQGVGLERLVCSGPKEGGGSEYGPVMSIMVPHASRVKVLSTFSYMSAYVIE